MSRLSSSRRASALSRSSRALAMRSATSRSRERRGSVVSASHGPPRASLAAAEAPRGRGGAQVLGGRGRHPLAGRLFGGVADGEELADGGEGEAHALQAQDALQAPDVGGVVEAEAAGGAVLGGDEAELFVVLDRPRAHAEALGDAASLGELRGAR